MPATIWRAWPGEQWYGSGGCDVGGHTGGLFPALEQQDAYIAAGALAGLDLPVTLVFGAADRYLSPLLARHLADLFRHAAVHLVDGASHWPQWDQPGEVAKLIMQAAPPVTAVN